MQMVEKKLVTDSNTVKVVSYRFIVVVICIVSDLCNFTQQMTFLSSSTFTKTCLFKINFYKSFTFE